jgi:heavy metal sensor kinase
MPAPGFRTRFTRRLGFRLASGYVIFFAFLLVLVGLYFRSTMISIQESQIRELLEEDWATLGGFLQQSGAGLMWAYNADSPQDSFLVERLQRVLLLADQNGNLLQVSAAYRVIGVETPAEIRRVLQSDEPTWKISRDPWGTSYMIRLGRLIKPDGRRYFVAQGRNMALNDATVRQFTWQYFAGLPVLVLFGGLLGWVLTRRALQPLQEVVRASESITGSNLSLRIPLREAGDELDRLIDTFNRMIGRLEDSFQQMRQFTADVSHELRTPITAVRGQLEVALMTARGEEQLREAILTALDEAERLSNFVKAMLQLSQAESGQLVLRKAPQDLCLVIRNILDQFHVSAEEAGLRLAADLPAECIAEIDRIQFERLLSNLLSNAVKYTPAGGTVLVELRANPHRVEIAVEDTGRGIPSEHLPHIFDRFFRVPSVDPSSSRGLGLGLSFVAWIARAHGGRVDVTSTQGKGSRFLVTLPLTSAPVFAAAVLR